MALILRHGMLFPSLGAVEAFEHERDTRKTTLRININCSRCQNLLSPPPEWSVKGSFPLCPHCNETIRSFYGAPGEVLYNNTNRAFWQLIVTFDYSCALCIQGSTYIGCYHSIPYHKGCHCENRVIRPGETSAPFIDFLAELKRLDVDQQYASMGRNNWLLFQSGRVKWTDIVTPGRVRDFEEVMDREKVSLEDMARCGITEADAIAAWNRVYTPERLDAQKRMREAWERLRKAGLSDDEIKSMLGRELLSRIKIGRSGNDSG